MTLFKKWKVMKMNELKSCPFCGGEAVMHERWDSRAGEEDKK